MLTDQEFITLQEKTQCQVHLIFERALGNLKEFESSNSMRLRRCSSEHQQVLGNNEPLFRFSNPENSTKSVLEEHKDYILTEAKSEVGKQECRAHFLGNSIRDLQRQFDSNRLEIYCTNQRCEESRKRASQTS